MIKENELRIGSILNYLTAEGDICLATIDCQDLKWLNEDPKGFNMVHSVIELTPEWLIKFGFEEKERDHSIIYFIGINFVTNDYLFDITWIEGYSYPFYRNGYFEIKYVHQLQNLYFALTGEELEVNQH